MSESNLGIDFSSIDEDDLDFELDAKLVEAEIKTTQQSAAVSDDKFVFKVPDIPKISGGGMDNTLGQLFDDDDDGEDEEDFLIRTQSFMPTSTQNAQSEGARLAIDANLTIIGTQAPSDLLDKNRSDINNNDGERVVDKADSPQKLISLSDGKSKGIDKSIWSFALSDLKDPALRDTIKELNISYYNNIIFGNEFFKVSILKLPLLLTSIKEISNKDCDIRAVLTDQTDDYLLGVISKKIGQNHLDKLHAGSVLLLQDIVIMRVNNRKNCRSSINLIINAPSLIKIFYKIPKKKEDTGLGDQSVKQFSFNPINAEKIRSSISEFKKKLLKDPMSIEKAPEKPVGSSGASTNVNKSSGGSNSAYKRPTPYPTPLYKTSSMVRSHSSNQPLNNQINQQNNFKQPHAQSNNNTSKQFQFKTVSAQPLKTSPTPASQNEELLSQLIFGIEDEFLNDADD